jgi:threonyl-tRNA synthetase
MLVIGDKEVAENTVSVRRRSGEQLPAQPLNSFIAALTKEISDRT